MCRHQFFRRANRWLQLYRLSLLCRWRPTVASRLQEWNGRNVPGHWHRWRSTTPNEWHRNLHHAGSTRFLSSIHVQRKRYHAEMETHVVGAALWACSKILQPQWLWIEVLCDAAPSPQGIWDSRYVGIECLVACGWLAGVSHIFSDYFCSRRIERLWCGANLQHFFVRSLPSDSIVMRSIISGFTVVSDDQSMALYAVWFSIGKGVLGIAFEMK